MTRVVCMCLFNGCHFVWGLAHARIEFGAGGVGSLARKSVCCAGVSPEFKFSAPRELFHLLQS